MKEGEDATVDNDNDWVDFEQQQLDDRREELLKVMFWYSQDPKTLKRVYQDVFPDI